MSKDGNAIVERELLTPYIAFKGLFTPVISSIRDPRFQPARRAHPIFSPGEAEFCPMLSNKHSVESEAETSGDWQPAFGVWMSTRGEVALP